MISTFIEAPFELGGDVVDVYPAGEENAYRIEFLGDEVERITQIDPLTGEILKRPTMVNIFPGSHYVTPYDKLKVALGQIELELDDRLKFFKNNSKLLRLNDCRSVLDLI